MNHTEAFDDLLAEQPADWSSFEVYVTLDDARRLADAGADVDFPLMEMLDVRVVERATGAVIGRSVGNNFSSYVRDHDFSVVLPAHAATSPVTSPRTWSRSPRCQSA